MSRRNPVWSVVLLVLALLVSGCAGRTPPAARPPNTAPTATSEPPTPAPTSTPADTPTPTPVPPTPTPTIPPLSAQDRAYFMGVYALRAKYDRDFLSWSLMESTLKSLNPPDALASNHAKMLITLKDANFSADMFSLAISTWLLSLYCHPSSWDYTGCISRQTTARTNAVTYAEQTDSARELFKTQWAASQTLWDEYHVEHAATPVPTITPFPIPPVITAVPLKGSSTGAFDAAIEVRSVNRDAWQAIKTADSDADAPEAGKKYVMVTVKVTNQSNEPIWVNSSNFSLLIGNKVYEEADQSNPDDFEATELARNASTSGNVSFVVPKDSSTMLLLFLGGDVALSLDDLETAPRNSTPPAKPEVTPTPTR